jgi:hypothetical protein
VNAFFIEPTRLEISRVMPESDKLSRTLRIAVVADLRTDVLGEYEWPTQTPTACA